MKVVTISGSAGAGKSTVINILRDFYGGKTVINAVTDYFRGETCRVEYIETHEQLKALSAMETPPLRSQMDKATRSGPAPKLPVVEPFVVRPIKAIFIDCAEPVGEAMVIAFLSAKPACLDTYVFLTSESA